MAYIGNKPANKAVVASDLDPAVITGQTALATSPADTDEFLISDAGVLKRLDASLVGGGLDHIFSVKLASDQSLSGSTITKVAFATEEIDTDSAFASNKFTVPSGQAGKYFFSAFIVISSVDARQQQLYIYKNGSVVKAVHHYTDAGEYDDIYDLEISCVLDLSATDYIEVYAQTDGSSIALTDGEYSSFQGFKLA